MNILAISDHELPKMLNVPFIKREFSDADIVISCGDLPAHYIEFVTSILGLPLFYVRGNHDGSYVQTPPGGEDLHRKAVRFRGMWLAGLEGCRRYNKGAVQFTEQEMMLNVLGMMPGMLLRRVRLGVGVDVMVTHASPFGIHDREDRPHVGFRAYLSLMKWYRPRYLIHGHIDVWDRRDTTWTEYLDTQVVNINPVRKLVIETSR